MTDLIDRKELLSKLKAKEDEPCYLHPDEDYIVGVIDSINIVEEAPEVKAVPVAHGRWIVHYDHFAPYQKCSACGFEIPMCAGEGINICLYKHCPECTARMDEEHDA